MTRDVTLVVPVYGRVDELQRLLTAVDEQARGGPPLPVIVMATVTVPARRGFTLSPNSV